MTARKQPMDKDGARQLRTQLFEAIHRGELSIQEATRQMRKISRLTQADFASHRGVSTKVIKEIERGLGNPTVSTLNRIGEFFGLEVAFVRKEGLHASATQQHSLAAAGSDGISRAAAGQLQSPIEDSRRLLEELEKIRKMVTPPDALRDAYYSIEQGMTAIARAQRFFAQEENNPGFQLTELERLMQNADVELNALQQARQIMESVEKLQQQIQPPPALKKWLNDIEAAKKMLAPLDSFSSGTAQIDT